MNDNELSEVLEDIRNDNETLKDEINRLRQLVRSAYIEGKRSKSPDYTNCGILDYGWPESFARKALFPNKG